MSNLDALQEWYARQCDGTWEHQYGVSISTLDNPGWSLKIDLISTSLAQSPFSEVKVDRSESDWFVARRSADVFESFGAINNLGEMIRTFVNWEQTVRSA